MNEQNPVKTILEKKQRTLEDAHKIFCFGAERIGFDQMIYAMASFFEKLSGSAQKRNRHQQKVLEYLLELVMDAYDLQDQELYANNIVEYRYAKWIFSHLAYKYLRISYEKMSEDLSYISASRGKVERAVSKCQSILDTEFILIPDFKENYYHIEKALIQFIAQLE